MLTVDWQILLFTFFPVNFVACVYDYNDEENVFLSQPPTAGVYILLYGTKCVDIN